MDAIELFEVGGGVGVMALPLGFSKGDKLAKLPKDFNPETHEVLVVPKDARRVWANGSRMPAVHVNKPEWLASPGYWQSANAEYLSRPLHRILPEECVEFVQIATRFPPEPAKPVASASPPNADYQPQTGMAEVFTGLLGRACNEVAARSVPVDCVFDVSMKQL